MTKKNNQGIKSLKGIDISSLTSGADLNEKDANVTAKDKSTNNKLVLKSLRIPTYLNKALNNIKEQGKYTGSINSYITEAIRKQLIKDGHIE